MTPIDFQVKGQGQNFSSLYLPVPEGEVVHADFWKWSHFIYIMDFQWFMSNNNVMDDQPTGIYKEHTMHYVNKPEGYYLQSKLFTVVSLTTASGQYSTKSIAVFAAVITYT